MRFKPDIAIIFIGWNNLYADCPGASKLRILRASDYLYNTVFKREQVVKDGKLYFADHYWDSSAAEARRYGSRYQPSFLPQVRQLIDNISNNGVRPIIVTLPGLFSVDNPPSIEALQMGHLPSCTKNAYALAAMSRKYNDELRALATEKHIPLIDLEKWGQTTLVPPESWFFDSMHLWSEGQTTEGEYIAKELLSLGLIR
jgi:lysophospholipase L1-like esterase